jgi:hypothetical protein
MGTVVWEMGLRSLYGFQRSSEQEGCLTRGNEQKRVTLAVSALFVRNS